MITMKNIMPLVLLARNDKNYDSTCFRRKLDALNISPKEFAGIAHKQLFVISAYYNGTKAAPVTMFDLLKELEKSQNNLFDSKSA